VIGWLLVLALTHSFRLLHNVVCCLLRPLSAFSGLQKKERGNFWFSRNDFSSAIHCYRRATEFLDATEDEMQLLHAKDSITQVAPDDDQKTTATSSSSAGSVSHLKSQIRELIDLRATAFNNLAAAQMKAGTFDQALKSVNVALDLSPDNVKALFRKGKILAAKNDFAEAIQCLKLAAQLEPESRVIAQEISSLAAKRKQEIANERRLYQKMLQVDPSSSSSAATSKKTGNWLLSCFDASSVSASRFGLLFATCSAVIVGILIFYTISN
jgi:FK506-binding protein 8